MSRIVGIDLGTTNSLVATVDSGIPLVIADSEGRRLTPSVVHFPRRTPSRSSATKPTASASSNRRKRSIRSSVSSAGAARKFPTRRNARDLSARNGDGGGAVTIPIHGQKFSPEEISAAILKKIKARRGNYFGEPVTRAVITVPAYFNDAQRDATRRAGELAGFTVERIVNEPTAAALAYGLDKLREKSKIAVYDLGGGTFDLSILELNDGVFQVLATNGNTRLGGDDLDRRLVDFLVEKIKHRTSRGSVSRVRNESDRLIAFAHSGSGGAGENQTFNRNRS